MNGFDVEEKKEKKKKNIPPPVENIEEIKKEEEKLNSSEEKKKPKEVIQNISWDFTCASGEESPFLNAYKTFYQDKFEKFLENAIFLEYVSSIINF